MQKNYICGAIFILFLSLAIIAAAFSVFSSTAPSGNLKKLSQGAVATTYEKDFDKHLVHQNFSRSMWNTMGYVLFGEGKEGVLIGQDGWLFTNEEFAKGADAEGNIQRNKDYIVSVSQHLKQDNVKLLIVPIPSKARIYQDKLGSYKFPSYWKSQYLDLLSFLKEHKIAAVDLLLTFENTTGDGLFFKTDTHWTTLGALSSAMLVEGAVARNFPYLSWAQQPYKSSKGEMVEHEGDLMRYTAKGAVFGIKKDKFYPWNTEPVGNGDPADEDLFGDVSLPVTLVGTSYSANKLWNFEGFLKEMLATDILNVADEGLGPFEVMETYLKSDDYKDSLPRLVIWEMPERYLSMNNESIK